MWGDRIKNMRSAIEKVADVVAPPIEDSEDFDEDNDNVEDEDYLDFGDEDDIGSEEDDQDYNVTSDGGGIGAFKGPFGKGMAGMLSRVSDAVAPPGEGIDGSEEFSSSSEFVGTQNTKRAPFGKGGVVGMLSRVSDAVTTGGAGAGDSEQLEESEEFFSGQLEPDSSSAMKSHSGKGIVESMLPLVSDVVAPPIEKEDDFQGATASEELGTFATGEFMSEELTSEEFVSEELGSPIQQQQPTFKSGEPAVIDTAATTENEYDSSMLAAAAQSEFGRTIDDKEDSSSRDHVEESVTRVTTPPPVETDEAHNITPPKRESGTVGPSYRVPTKSISDLGMQSCTGTTELNAHSSVQSETNTPDTEEARVLRARSCSSSLSTIVPDFNALDSNAHDGKGDADPVLPSRQSSKDFVDEDVNIGETVDNNSNSAPSNGEMRFESGDHAVCNTRPPITPVRYVSEASDLANMLTQDTAVPVAASTVASAADTNLAEQEVNADLGDDAPDCKDSRTSPKYQLVPNGWFPPDAANKSMLKPPVQKETPLAIKTRRKLEEDCKTQKGTHSKLTSNPEASPQRRKKKRTPKINAKGNNKNNETTLAESVPTTEVGDTAATTPSITTISETAQNKSPEVIESEQKYSPEDDGQQKPSVSDASAEQPKPQLSTLTNSTFAEASTIAAASTNASEPPSSSPRDTKRIEELEAHCLELQQQLREAENQIVSVQQQAAQQLKQEEKNRELMLQNFQEKEARVLGASMEDHKQEMDSVRNEMEASLTMMRHQMEREQEAAHREQEQMEQLLEEANKRVKAAELESHAALSHHESEASQQQKLQNRALRMAEDKLAQTMAVLDEREEQCQKLQATVKASQSKIKEQVKSLRESEEELDELHNENETLERQVTELQGMVSSLQGDSEKLSGLKVCIVSRNSGDLPTSEPFWWHWRYKNNLQFLRFSLLHPSRWN